VTVSRPLRSTASPSPRKSGDGHRQRLAELLRRPRYEVLPLPGTAELVQEHVPTTLPVTVTASPRRGLEPTLALTEALITRGFRVVPHLAARLVRDEQHLADILGRLHDGCVQEVFVVAGDGNVPVGEFTDSLQLLTAIERHCQSGSSPHLTSVGVTGYPEGHPLVSDDELSSALLAKQPLSSYVVTQMCFDAGAVDQWVGQARERGCQLPVHVGVAGAVDPLKLLRVAGRIGVGSSLGFLRKHHGGAKLLRPGGYRADDLISELAADAVPPGRRVAGLHVYTFGDVAATERWRRELLDRLGDGDDDG
jgi:methylenetetrahydrofolate reductase (NADPH)